MPEANVLYSVTAVVVVGLIAWVAVVLRTAKEPWAREPKVLPESDVPGATEGARASTGASTPPAAEADADAKAKPAEAKSDGEPGADAKA